MNKRSIAGQFEQMVMTAILMLGDQAYGISIHGKVKELAHPKRVSLGAVYVTLDRMEDKGFVRSWLSDPTPERGGRSKRYYQLKPSGEKALRESVLMGQRMSRALIAVRGLDWTQMQSL